MLTLLRLKDIWQVLVIIDVHSKWIDAVPLQRAIAATTVCALVLKGFPNFGISEELVSDNGSQFTAQTFSEFCNLNDIKHSLMITHAAILFGAAERLVQEVKQDMRKMGSAITLKERFAIFLAKFIPCRHH